MERYPLSRDGAVLLCRQLQDDGYLRHVKGEHKFSDDHLFFLWAEPGKSRNVVEVTDLQPSDAKSESVAAAAAAAESVDHGASSVMPETRSNWQITLAETVLGSSIESKVGSKKTV